jgi:undecaprenyl-diphosphatase
MGSVFRAPGLVTYHAWMAGPDTSRDQAVSGCGQPGPLPSPRPAQSPQPLLPLSARRPAAVIAAGCAVVTLVLAVLVAGASRPDGFDRAADTWLIARLAARHRELVLLMDLGEPVQVTVMTVLLAAGCLAARRVNGAVLAAVTVPATAALTELVLKPLVGRTLGSSEVYPSGHTSRAFALAAVLVVLLLRPAGAPGRRVLPRAVMAVSVLLAAGVGIAMTSLGYHYLTDIIGGAATGGGVVLTATFLLDPPAVLRRLDDAGARLRRPSG